MNDIVEVHFFHLTSRRVRNGMWRDHEEKEHTLDKIGVTASVDAGEIISDLRIKLERLK